MNSTAEGYIELYEEDNSYTESIPVFQCSSVYGYNNSWTVTQWALYTTDGTRVYISGHHNAYTPWELNLKDIGVEANAQLRLKAVVTAGKDSTASVLLEYVPDSKVTAYFELRGNIFTTTLVFCAGNDPY